MGKAPAFQFYVKDWLSDPEEYKKRSIMYCDECKIAVWTKEYAKESKRIPADRSQNQTECPADPRAGQEYFALHYPKP